MGRPTVLLSLALVAAAGWFVLQHYEVRGLRQVRLARKTVTSSGDSSAARTEGTVRVASFNLDAFGPSKADKPEVMEILARIIRRFDVVALQEVRSNKPEPLVRLLEHVNAEGGRYDMVAGPRVGRTADKEQYAIVFDGATIEIDRSASYTVDDPDDLLHRPPFVAWFRARGAPADRAFTFSLVVIHIDPEDVEGEMRVLDNVFFKVRDDGRGEDDVVMLGSFHADDQHLGDLGRLPGITPAVSETPTNTLQNRQYDNVVFQIPATSEYTGRGGVFDFMREFNLTIDQALVVSDHAPVWAEFSVEEGDANVLAVSQGEPSTTHR